MPALDLIRPSVTAMRVIASVNAEFARELKLPPHIRSLGLISADSDDVTYIAADEATKQAMVEVVYGRSLYAGAAHGPSPTAGEVLIMLGGPNPAEVRAGLDAVRGQHTEVTPGGSCRCIGQRKRHENGCSGQRVWCWKRTKTAEILPDGRKNVENFCIYPLTFGE